MRHRFTAKQSVPWPIEVVFAFFAQPENLPRIMPAWQQARIEDALYAAPPPNPQQKAFAAGVGSRMAISFRPFPYAPFRLKWKARITGFEWNRSFCDEQETGPFAYWQHCHHLHCGSAEAPGNVTQISDEVEYALPLGPLGNVANGLFVERQMRATFAYRHRATLEWLERLIPGSKTAL